ncbi:class I SAM-dependent methyltransferase [Pseudonocardia sp. ICBG1142]|uniref:class I SAM-dependent methyltransferase n=1 Tax=Pseudonocardia sp. ICBG1142 TaxID=2846760 RepID=UPI001CF680B5|nr:class I SAM-dependent methyltransferase [Pseudonocardia sp. ICBG1142]
MASDSQYDVIGAAYDAVKDLPAARYAEIPTVRSLLGDLTGLAVLDVGCGTGHYSRICRELGAATVVGADSSAKMIAEARRRESTSTAPISYHVHDAAALPLLGTYDVVLAVYLFNYAPDRATVRSMLRSIHANCRDGTRIVALLTDANAPLTRPELRTYKIEYTIVKESSDVVELDFTAHCDPLVTLRLHAPRRDVLNDCLHSEGFREVHWRTTPVSPTGLEQFGGDYWVSYQEIMPWITFTAIAST